MSWVLTPEGQRPGPQGALCCLSGLGLYILNVTGCVSASFYDVERDLLAIAKILVSLSRYKFCGVFRHHYTPKMRTLTCRVVVYNSAPSLSPAERKYRRKTVAFRHDVASSVAGWYGRWAEHLFTSAASSCWSSTRFDVIYCMSSVMTVAAPSLLLSCWTEALHHGWMNALLPTKSSHWLLLCLTHSCSIRTFMK